MKKSIIKKSITRKISTAPYETLDVHVEIQEEIEWENMQQRIEKADSVSKILILDFVKTLNQVAAELHVDKKIASISGKKNPQEAQEKPVDTSINNSKDGDVAGADFDFLS
jgi:hypothetical protein